MPQKGGNFQTGEQGWVPHFPVSEGARPPTLQYNLWKYENFINLRKMVHSTKGFSYNYLIYGNFIAVSWHQCGIPQAWDTCCISASVTYRLATPILEEKQPGSQGSFVTTALRVNVGQIRVKRLDGVK